MTNAAIQSGLAAQCGSGWLPETQKAVCRPPGHQVNQPRWPVISHRGGRCNRVLCLLFLYTPLPHCWLTTSPPCPISRNPGFSCCPESCDPADVSQAVSQPAHCSSLLHRCVCCSLFLVFPLKLLSNCKFLCSQCLFFSFFLTLSFIHPCLHLPI